MATFSNIDLKHRRESLKMSAADLAERVPFDADTIYKIEAGKRDVNPDEMFFFASALGDLSIWVSWMRTKYSASYGRMHPDSPQYDLKGCSAIVGGMTESANGRELAKAQARLHAHEITNARRLAAIHARREVPTPRFVRMLQVIVIALYLPLWGAKALLDKAING